MGQHNLLLLFLLGTIFTAVPHAMVANALKHLRAKTFSLVACMQPFYGVVFAIIMLNEQPTWQTLLGGLLVISAAIYETINTHKIHKRNLEQAQACK
jgi:drug/metabolite transporter (DMT)-like permease